ncbi:MAG: hypothetical protein H5T68_02255 [Chloroflexi bacterium]|nr:hypothetical protein [Chloroflexota bacterium]
MEEAVLLVMTGTHPATEIEQMMANARLAITQDTIERARTVPGISQIVLSTNAPSLAEWARAQGVTVELDVPGSSFHFGKHLRDLVAKYRIRRLFYMGGGSGALLSADEMAAIVDRLRSTDRVLITNNFYSTDLAAFTPADVLDRIEPPAIDNDLGWVLAEQAGLPNESLTRRASTQFDVDTPTDLMILTAHPGVGAYTRAFLDNLRWDISHIEQALRRLVDRDAEVLVAGRVSAAVWEYLERETACRVRVFAEERGMRASGRQARGEARSLLGYYYQQVGPQRFFETLAELSQAVFLDSRVLFAHLRVWPPAGDRYNSDLRRPQHIADAIVREFTQAAMSAPVPVVLGGHSLVAGGLYALVEAAWARSGADVPRYVDHTVWHKGKTVSQLP